VDAGIAKQALVFMDTSIGAGVAWSQSIFL
jgi:hypothetical protein